MRHRSLIPVVAFTLLFTSCIAFAYLWFNTDIGRSDSQLPGPPKRSDGGSTNNSQSRLWLQARTNIEGYTFIPEPVSDAVKETLGTTNILSGTFYRTEDRSERSEVSGQNSAPTSDIRPLTSGESALRPPASNLRKNSQLSTIDSQLPIRITVFLASWPAESKKSMMVLSHTPDVCWGGRGWKLTDPGQPRNFDIEIPSAQSKIQNSESNINIDSMLPSLVSAQPTSQLSALSHSSVPFECRIFQWPETGKDEFVVWTTLVAGAALSRSIEPIQVQLDSNENGNEPRRLTVVSQFLETTRKRLRVRGAKQFVRYSVPATDKWREDMEKVKVFGAHWLIARSI